MRLAPAAPYTTLLPIVLCLVFARAAAAQPAGDDVKLNPATGDSNGGAGDGDGGDGDGSQDIQNWSSLIGIVTAIVGNTLIALALNVQRYAHVRLHKRRIWAKERAKQAMTRVSTGGHGGYGTMESDRSGSNRQNNSDRLPLHSNDVQAASSLNDSNSNEADPLTQSMRSDYSADSKDPTTYLKDPYWWTGQVLITVGETGNFLAYGFAPASIVSPLGVVTLVANCVVAPIMFHERFRARDFWGVVIAVFGVVTVVLSANQKETKLGPHEVWDAITTLAFEVYLCISCTLIACLMWLSPRYGNRTILIDLGLVGLFGAYTALSTKGVSSMLSSTLFRAFTTPVTYALIFVLLATAVMQIRYLNKALQRFDSTQVIPIQFVLFTLSVILGSAVLYRDFERTTTEQAFKFVGGCLLTFFGVFLITSGRPPADDEDEHLSDEEGVEETLRLSLQNSNQRPAPVPVQPDENEASASRALSRRSSKSSKIGFLEAALKPFTPFTKETRPSPSRGVSVLDTSRSPLPTASPPENHQEEPSEDLARRPLIQRQAASADSILTLAEDSHPVPCYPATEPVTPHNGLAGSYSSPAGYLPEGPLTPTTTRRAGVSKSASHTHTLHNLHHHHTSHHLMINPSPLSSTVNAMIGDSLIGDGETPIRRASYRRSRPSLRSSLFVPHDELSDEDNERAPLFSNEEDIREEVSSSEPNHGVEGYEERHRGLRGRARSLSHTLHDLFGGVRLLRRNTSPAVNTLGREGTLDG